MTTMRGVVLRDLPVGQERHDAGARVLRKVGGER